jgi:hypothetical protein
MSEEDNRLDSAKLAADLKRSTSVPVVPPELDAAILASARDALRKRGRRVIFVRWAGAVAAAAAILLVVTVSTLTRRVQTATAPLAAGKSVEAREDVNGDGRVDILDAFALARKVDAHSDLVAEWDLNGDGIVDGKDVDVVAAAAVSVTRSEVKL